MTIDGAIDLVRQAMLVAARVGSPALVAALVMGVIVGMLQASTQVNEPSVTFLLKLVAIGVAVTIAGPYITATMVEYTRMAFSSVAQVVQ